MTQDEISRLLESLRWRKDMVVTNPFGERVWLKAICDKNGKQIGITDCCPEFSPCERHKKSKEVE